MTFRDWFNDLEAAGEPPTLVSILVFAAVFLPAIFLVGLAGPVLEQVRYDACMRSNAALAAGAALRCRGD